MSLMAAFSVLVQTALPALTVLPQLSPVWAQEETQTPTPEPTPEPTLSPEPTEEATPTPEVTTTVEPTPTEEAPTPTDTVEATPTQEADQPQSSSDQPPQNNGPPTEQGEILDGATTTAPEATPTPTVTAVQPELTGELQTIILENVEAVSLDLDNVDPSNSATLTTDKADYAPTDTAFISGTGFEPNHTYSLAVMSDDYPATSTTVDVTTDEAGSFAYAYQLDGTYRPNYRVEVRDGSHLVATTTFTDSDSGFVNPNQTIASNNVTSPDNGWLSDNARATFDNGNDTADYGFPDLGIPVGATIDGIEVTVEGQTTGRNLIVSLWNISNSTPDDYTTSKTATLSGTDTTQTLGGATDKWGKTWTVADFADADFKIRVGATGGGNSDALLDQIRVKVYYTEAAPTSTPTATPTGTVTPTPTPSGGTGPISEQNIACMADQPAAPSGLNCTANDISIASVSNINIIESSADGINFAPTTLDECEYPGQYIKFTASWNVLSTASQRYNVGLWFANQGQTSALHGSCSASTLPSSPSPFFEGSGDSCGDITSASTGTVNPAITVVAQCVAAPGTDQLRLPYCTSWDNNQRTAACTGPAGTVPGTPSKCKCDDGFTIPITVPPAIEVIKNISPTNDPGLFNLQVNSVTEEADATHLDTTGKVGVTTGSNTFGETAGTSTSLGNYSSTASCILRGTQTAVPASQSGNTWTIANVTNGQDIVCTITNTRINNASLTIIKDAQPNDAQDFSFTTTGTGLSNFSLDDDADNTLQNTQVFSNLAAGTYSVSEGAVAGWTQASAICSDQSSVGSINLSAGENVTCTFTNTKLGKIIVEKQTDPDGSNQSFDFTATYDGDGFSLSDGQQNDSGFLPAGTYAVSETAPAGWDLTNTNCVSSLQDTETAANLDLDAGETITCTFTNTQRGHIIVDKITDPAGSQQNFDFVATGSGYTNFSLTDAATPNDQEVIPGVYGVSETVPSGWDLTSATCSDQSNPSSITVSAGETVTCTFTNQKDANIIVVKQTLPDGSQQAFEFDTDFGDNFFLSDGQSTDSGDLNPGTYSVDELALSGWDETGATCSDQSTPSAISLQAGETVTCTFTNTQRGSVGGVKYEDANGNGIDDGDWSPVANWVIQLWKWVTDAFVNTGMSDTTDVNGAFSFDNLLPGLYQLREIMQAGWTNVTSDTIDVTVTPGESDTENNFVNTQYGSITVVKQTDPDGSQQAFEFDTTFGSNFFLSDGQSTNSGELLPGTYAVSELTPAGWDLTNVTCSDQSDPSEIELSSGEDVTCTFTNQQDAHIVVVKQTDPDGSDVSFEFDTNYGSNFFLSDGQSSDSGDLNPGTYSVDELTPEGWDETSATCSDQSPVGAISLQAGETVTCTFNNQADASIVVVKQTIPDGNETVFDFDLSYGDGDADLSDGQSDDSGDLAPGTYSVSETVLAGWDLTNTSCSDGSQANAINLAAGETVTCTFTNTQRGHIIVDKITNPTGSQQSFSFDGTGGTYADFSLTDTADPNDQELVPGTYGVSETVPTGWNLTNTSCTSSISDNESAGSLELDPGETITCTFTNTQLGNVTVVKYNDRNGNGQKDEGEETLGDTGIGAEVEATRWEIHLDGTGVDADQWTGAQVQGQVTFSDLLPNSFTLGEQIKAGWVQTNISCGLKDEVYSAVTDTLAFNLTAGQNLTCYVGNQGQATVTVYKNIDANGDGDLLDAEIDVIHAPGWTWDIDGSGNYSASEEENTVENIPAGTHTISEDQQENYHVTSLVCGDTNYGAVESQEVTLTPGQDLVCTFTNTRDTGTIIVHKIIDADGNTETTDDQFAGVDWEVDVNGDSEDTSNPDAQSTNASGSATFAVLKTGSYDVSESQQPGYELVDAYCDNENGSPDGETIYGVDVAKDQTVNCTFINSPNSTIHGYKWHDKNMSGGPVVGFDEDLLSGWTINLYEVFGEGQALVDTFVTDGADHFGWYWFTNLFPGTYKVCEELQTGWDQTYPLNETEDCHMITLPSDSSSGNLPPELVNAVAGPMYNFGNVELGDLRVYKYSDENGNGVKDEGEEYLGGWEMNLTDGENSSSQETNEDGYTDFGDLTPGVYGLSETQQNGWLQTGITCDNEQVEQIEEPVSFGIGRVLAQQEENPTTKAVEVGAGEEVVCEVGNQPINPDLFITKTNNTGGADKGPGNTVLFTLTVTATASAVLGVTVTDLPSLGFTYQNGSWTATSSIHGPLSIPEPTYASPGTWSLGDMEEDEVITLTYLAKIGGDIQSGLYRDLAWARGTNILSDEVVANDETGVFVGTEVNIVRSDVSGTSRTVIQTNDVLGASTELPATGASLFWLAMAGILGLAGVTSMTVGVALTRRNKKSKRTN